MATPYSLVSERGSARRSMALVVNLSCAWCASPLPDTGPDSRAVTAALAAILIFTIVADVLGNVLVILSVYRNKKLRNAGRERTRYAAHTVISV